MLDYYVINPPKIQQYLWKLDQLDPERTWWNLDLLIENVHDNLLDILKTTPHNKIMLEVDHDNKHVSLLWKPLPSQNRKILFDSQLNQESIYRTIVDALYEAENRGLDDEYIKVIAWNTSTQE